MKRMGKTRSGTHELGELKFLKYPDLSKKLKTAGEYMKEAKFFENNNDVFVNNPFRKHDYKHS